MLDSQGSSSSINSKTGLTGAGSSSDSASSQKHSATAGVGTEGVSPIYRCAVPMLKFDDALRRFFYQLGHFASDHEQGVIVFSLLLCLGITTGILFQVNESDAQKIWIPQDSTAQVHRRYVEATYPPAPNIDTIILTPKNGGNVFTLPLLKRALELQNRVSAISKGSTRFLDQTLCVTRPKISNPAEKECIVNSVFVPWSSNATLFDAQPNLGAVQATLRQLETQEVLPTSLLTVLLANVKRNGQEQISSASAMRLQWWTWSNDTRSEDWEGQWLNDVPTIAKDFASDFDVYYSSQRSIQDELSRAVNNNLVFFGFAFILIVLYCAMTLGQRDRVHSKVALSLCGILAVVLSIGVMFGICGYIGVFNTPVTSVIPFLVLGIGVDDMFIIVDSFERVPKANRSIPQRIGLGLANAGASITMTSLTDILAFVAGTLTVLPAIQSFCIHAALAVAVDFTLQVTFFVSCLSLDVKRREHRRYDCLCCIEDSREAVQAEKDVQSAAGSGGGMKSMSAAQLATMSSPARSPRKDRATLLRDESLSGNGARSQMQRTSSFTRSQRTKPQSLEEQMRELAENPESTGLLSRFLGEYYTPFLLHPITRVVVVAGFATIVAFGVLGALQLQQDFEIRQLAPDGSYLVSYLDAEDREWPNQEVPFTIYTQNFDHAVPSNLDSFTTVLSQMRANTWVQDVSQSWLEAFRTFVKARLPASSLSSDVPSNKTQFYEELSLFLRTSGARFRSSVRFKDEAVPSDGIVSTSTGANLKPLANSSVQVDAMTSVRNVASETQKTIKWFPFSFNFIFFEQFAVIEYEAFQNLILAGVAVLLACTLFLVHPGAAFIVFLNVAMIDAGLLGFMYYVGLSIDSLTVANLVMAVGLSVDYSAHICHQFMSIPGDDRVQRTIAAMGSMGSSVLAGATSTFLGIVVLGIAPAELYRVFFRMFVGTIVLGMAHGLVFLPVVLATIGPAPLPHVVLEHKRALEEMDLKKRGGGLI